MGQLTIRAGDDLIFRVRQRAHETGRSMNEYVTIVLEAATDPSLAGTEVERTRERLARAGLLAMNPRRSGTRPDPAAVAAAGRRAARGQPLSEIVSDGR